MPLSEARRRANKEWDRKNVKRIGCVLYRGDAEALEALAKQRGTSVNALLRNSVSEILGRPLEKRT